jgi:2-dehydropantoate 2-reductase
MERLTNHSLTRFTAPSERSYTILGTGALGGFCGARLQQAGLRVRFLLHHDYSHVRQQGLRVESPLGDIVLPQVNAFSSHHVLEVPRSDVVVIALKTTQNDILRSLLPRLMKPDGMVLVLQNGLGVETDIARLIGPDRVLGGICFVCASKVGPGHIQHANYDFITIGGYAPGYAPVEISDRIRAIGEDWERAGFTVSLTEDLLLARWQKLVCNIPFNGLSVILNATTREIMKNSHTRSLVEQIMQEVVATAAAQGCRIGPKYVQKRLQYTAQMEAYRTSMKIDYEQGRALEVETIIGNPLRIAQQTGIATPQIAMLYQQLKFYDTHNPCREPISA